MKRDNFRKILEKDMEYKPNTVDKMFQGKAKPKLENAIKMQEEFDIPVTVWKNKQTIESFINGNNTIDNQSTASTNEKEGVA